MAPATNRVLNLKKKEEEEEEKGVILCYVLWWGFFVDIFLSKYK